MTINAAVNRNVNTKCRGDPFSSILQIKKHLFTEALEEKSGSH